MRRYLNHIWKNKVLSLHRIVVLMIKIKRKGRMLQLMSWYCKKTTMNENLKNEFTLKVTKTTKIKSPMSIFKIKVTYNRIKSSSTKYTCLFLALTRSS